MRSPLVAMFLFCVSAAVAAGDLPPGWRLPVHKELADEPLRERSANGYTKVVADFNGDGLDDEALLLKSTTFSGEALWVRLSDPNADHRWVKLAEIRWGKEYPNVDLGMGIDLVPPGVHAYACFDGATECDWSDRKFRPKLRLQDPALLYFRFESAASMFFWSKKKQRFLRVWLSD